MNAMKSMLLGLLALGTIGTPAAAQGRPPAAQTRPAAAKPRPEPRGFVAINVAAARPGSTIDAFTYEAYVETATANVELPSATGALIDVSAGRRVWNRLGFGLAVSRGSTTQTASVDARVPHPLFDDQHRTVEGDASGLSRTETAAHVQAYYEPRLSGRARVRLFAGPSFFRVEQSVVEAIEVNETYPFDTATFGTARAGRAKGSAVGAHAGIDLSWRLSRRVGAGVMLRYGHATMDLNAAGSRRVSTNGGGVDIGGGLRMAF